VEEMDVTDLSAWLGRPPTTPNVQQNSKSVEDAEAGSDSSNEPSLPEEAEIADLSDSDVEQAQSEAEEQGSLASEEEQASHRGSSPKLQNGFYVDIPKIPNKDEYEHLPGHFTVDRVLSEHSQERYLVKLRSGEVELVCVPKCSSTSTSTSTFPSFGFTYFRFPNYSSTTYEF
jgi:hypothetical protein